jgi:hypothetical protein
VLLDEIAVAFALLKDRFRLWRFGKIPLGFVFN